jgi:predicted nuclease of restriction endonuclease-like (RecB) superfamily
MSKKPKEVVKANGLAPLIEQVRTLVQSARRSAAGAVNTLQVLTIFEIGRLIVEHEQGGARRAEYGKETLKALAGSLTSEFGRGFSEDSLSRMRKFFLLWQDHAEQISATLSRKSSTPEKPGSAPQIAQTPSAQLPTGSIPQTPSGELTLISAKPSRKVTLSWSHYVLLLGIRDPDERSFYEIESANSDWSLSELKRQVASSLNERLALSRDKKRIRKLAEEGHTVTQPADLLRNPLVLEFLGLDEKPGYSETDLESALIDKLQHFLLELGKGFLFEARQKRFTFDEDHYFVDLVFYNRLLRCYVLFDLKLDKLGHQDLGQMQMYVNHYDRNVRTADENPTIGILLCKRKKDALIELTLPKNANVFASQYELYLPSKDDLRERLMRWTAEEEGRA